MKASTKPLVSPPRGTIISGRYRVQRKLGSGSAGTVYLVEDLSGGGVVALKVLRSERHRKEEVERLHREFRAIVDLRHPQIASAYDFGYAGEEGLPYYTREYIDGVPLEPGPAGPEGQAEPNRFLRPILDLLDALQYLHSHGILHLDVHAGNVIEANDQRRGGVLIDFGLGPPGVRPSSDGSAASCVTCPPELAAGETPGPAADIYGAGRLLLYRLTGHYDGAPRLPREVPGWGPRLTLELERILEKSVREDPAERFGSAAELRDSLLGALGETEGTAAPVEPAELTVGRDCEIQMVEESLRRSRGGGFGLLWLSGPLGIGKTRLLTEARWRAQVQGLPVIDLNFLPGGGAPPLEQQIRRALRGHPSEACSWLAPLDPSRGGTSAERARRAASSYFVGSGPPLALLVDDLDDADRESRLLLEALIAEGEPAQDSGGARRGLAVVVASIGPPPRGRLARKQSGRHRALKPLGATVARSLLETLLRPLLVSSRVLSRLAHQTRGYPMRLRQVARELRGRYGGAGRVPDDLGAGDLMARSLRSARSLACVGPHQKRVLRILATFRRATETGEIVAASGLGRQEVARALRELGREELVISTRQGRLELHHLADPIAGGRTPSDRPSPEVRVLHARAADYLQGLPSLHPAQRASLARHLVAAGRQREGRKAALEAAPLLVRQGYLDDAVRLLDEVSARERSEHGRFLLAEEISEIRSRAGDHLEGTAALEPFYRSVRTALGPGEAVRMRRRLGVHCHRAGQTRRALRILQEARRMADPVRDRTELIHIHAELAEFHTFRGEYEPAESYCREGLALLDRASGDPPGFREAMEVTLRASLGHLELRRMSLERAKQELGAALSLARKHASPVDRAMILNNLGIVHNDLDDFHAAARHFRRAERLLAAAGERRTMVQTACNLAMISAKVGDEAKALEDIDRASRLLKEHAGQRLEFTVGIARAFADHLLGRMHRAIAEFEEALPLGRELGDHHLVRFGEVYLAEAQLACGRYEESLRLLRAASSHASITKNAVLQRMASSRRLYLERILGRGRAAGESRRTLEGSPRTRAAFAEAWNDVFAALADEDDLDRAVPLLEQARRTFRRISVPAGGRRALVALLQAAVAREEGGKVRSLLIELEREEPTTHRLLSVLEPLTAAEAAFFLGELDRSARYLQEASGAIVGLPFLELDWRIELRRARIAERQEKRDVARHHLHRTLQARDLLVRYVPSSCRRSFLAHPRFRELEECRARLDRSVAAASTPSRPGEAFYGDLVGRSASMRGMYALVDRLRQVDVPVLVFGETGTGKELVARAVHRSSARRDGPFYSLHCSSLPSELFESELFGYAAGAFTGAEEARPGLLEYLRGGTLLLDEIAQLPPGTQSKLLHVIDRKVVRPLGSLETRPIDVRYIASSSIDPEEAVRSGSLREDLYYRLRAGEVRVPPLRERPGDVPLLLRHFLELHSARFEKAKPTISREALERLQRHTWPGNVRELEALVTRLVIQASPGAVVGPEAIVEALGPRREDGIFPDAVLAGRDLKDLRRELDRAYLRKLFRESGGKVRKVVEVLGIRRSYFYSWLRELGLDVQEMRRDL